MKRQNIYFTNKENETILEENINKNRRNVSTNQNNLTYYNKFESNNTFLNNKIDLNSITKEDLKHIPYLNELEIEKICLILEREVIFSFEELKIYANLKDTQLNSIIKHTYIDDSVKNLEKRRY